MPTCPICSGPLRSVEIDEVMGGIYDARVRRRKGWRCPIHGDFLDSQLLD